MNKIYGLQGAPLLLPEMKIFELIETDPSLVSVFQRLNISLPFGDMSIGEMCKRDGYSCTMFLMLCNMHISPAYRVDSGLLTRDMLPELVGYLRASHRYYIGYMLPHVASHLDDILSHCDNLSRSLFSRFYNDYMAFLGDHFREEESEIFAIVEGAENSLATDIGRLEAPHGDIDDRTNDLASLVIKSLPEAVPTTLRCAMLKDIYALRDDLRVHSRIEMHLLRPLVEKFLKTEEQ